MFIYLNLLILMLFTFAISKPLGCNITKIKIIPNRYNKSLYIKQKKTCRDLKLFFRHPRIVWKDYYHFFQRKGIDMVIYFDKLNEEDKQIIELVVGLLIN